MSARGVDRQSLKLHVRRVLVGAAFGLATALLCPQLPEPMQVPCRAFLALVHALVNT